MKPEKDFPLTEHQASLMKLADGTRTRKEVAALLGTTDNAVSVMSTLLRNRGHKLTYLNTERFARRVTNLSVKSVLDGLDQPIQDWLMKQIPKDSNITDTLRAIVTDAYHEETVG